MTNTFAQDLVEIRNLLAGQIERLGLNVSEDEGIRSLTRKLENIKKCPKIQANIYISPDGDDNTGNGTYDKPYATLNKAFANIGSKGVIAVMEGEYSLNGTYGLDNSNTSIDIVGIGDVIFKSYKQISFGDFPVNISNINFEKYGNYGLSVNTSSSGALINGNQVNIFNCTFCNFIVSNGNLVYSNYGSIYNCIFKDNTITNNACASTSNSGRIFNCKFLNNTCGVQQSSIYLCDFEANTYAIKGFHHAVYCNFKDNTYDTYDAKNSTKGCSLCHFESGSIKKNNSYPPTYHDLSYNPLELENLFFDICSGTNYTSQYSNTGPTNLKSGTITTTSLGYYILSAKGIATIDSLKGEDNIRLILRHDTHMGLVIWQDNETYFVIYAEGSTIILSERINNVNNEILRESLSTNPTYTIIELQGNNLNYEFRTNTTSLYKDTVSLNTVFNDSNLNNYGIYASSKSNFYEVIAERIK